MNLDTGHKIPRFDYLMLLPIMALAFYIAFIPHQDYPYPVHIDEWVHLAYANAMLETGSTAFIDPFMGQSTVGLIKPDWGAGFQVFWGIFHQISGISWLTIFRYFPSVVFILTVLSVYILARREGFGLEAAFFACLIPTSVGMLGPAFLVPVALGMPFIPLALFLVFNLRTRWVYLVLFLFTSALLLIHAATAVGLIIVLVPYILLNMKGDFKRSLWITLALAIPFLAPFPWIFDMLLPTAKSILTVQPHSNVIMIPQILQAYGYLPILFCLIGTFLLAMRGGKRNHALVLSLLVLLLMLAVYFTFQRGVPIMYYRGLLYGMLMMSIVAGAGLMGVRNLRLPERIGIRLKATLVTQNIGKVLCLVLVGLTLAIGIPTHQDNSYYYMIDKADYEAFVWIEDNLDDDYDKAMVDPWKATAFVAITGKNVFARTHFSPGSDEMEAYDFLNGGSSDTAFLRENNISIVYTESPTSNPDLTMVRDKVYLLTGGK